MKSLSSIAAVILATTMLSGCEEGALNLPLASGASQSAAPSGSDVERSDVFSVSEQALWDGRPTLGGVWVSHPDVDDPERVRITNDANGKSVIGALFKDERDLPGPALKMSSDAAAALGVVAGTPVTLSVVALRREGVVESEATTSTPAPDQTATSAADGPGLSEIVEASVGETSAPAPAAAPAPAGPAPAKPYVQVGVFSVLENAESLVSILAKNGVKAIIQEVDRNGTAVYRVVAGPAASRSEANALINQVKELGFNDAFFTR